MITTEWLIAFTGVLSTRHHIGFALNSSIQQARSVGCSGLPVRQFSYLLTEKPVYMSVQHETPTLEAQSRPAEPNPIKRVLGILGPGLITGASDDDPSGIGTYAVAGASLGYATLWTALVTFPMMTAVQVTCAKIGMVSGTGLAAVLRQRFPRSLVYVAVFALVVANAVNAGADMGAIAAAINLLVPIPMAWLIVPIGASILALQLWGSYAFIARCFKWLTLGLLTYVGSSLYAHPDWKAVLPGTFMPRVSLNPGYISTLVAIFGTTISPYLFFWQPSQEVEEEIELGKVTLEQRRELTNAELKAERWDTRIGMLFSNLIMYFIILALAPRYSRQVRLTSRQRPRPPKRCGRWLATQPRCCWQSG